LVYGIFNMFERIFSIFATTTTCNSNWQ
jgi:hypothetical protein